MGSDRETFCFTFNVSRISIHAPCVGSDSARRSCTTRAGNFNPRSPCGERLGRVPRVLGASGISIHAPRVGSDDAFVTSWGYEQTFQSTLPVWGATVRALDRTTLTNISIHAPRVGSDCVWSHCPMERVEFQSTLPVWGATRTSITWMCGATNFNPRSPCGERPTRHCNVGQFVSFQSTLPVWGATKQHDNVIVDSGISIHAPRVGSDTMRDASSVGMAYFNPRSPCGERPRATPPCWTGWNFNPRSPCGERLLVPQRAELSQRISIHAPRVGSDRSFHARAAISFYFNPRSPCGERPQYILPFRTKNNIL